MNKKTITKIEPIIFFLLFIKKFFIFSLFVSVFINNEIQELHAGLNQAFNLLRANGKICVVTFHSIEDRLVKNFTN